MSSTAGSTSHLFCESLIKVAASHKLDHFHIFKLCVFQGFLVQGKRNKPCEAMCGEHGGLIHLGMWYLATVAAQVEPSVLVSYDKFDTQQMNVFLVIYSKMRYKNISTLLNKHASFSVWLCGSYSCCTIPS